MTLTEITEIFSKAETQSHGGDTLYVFYTFDSPNGDGRGATVIDPRNLHELETTLEAYDFREYAPGQIPVFVKRAVIQGM
jgi:hypothetical protein